MNNFKVSSLITCDEILTTTIIVTSNNYASYHYVNANIEVEIKVKDEIYTTTLQTGGSFLNNDYALPSNQLSVYNSTALLEQLDQYCESDFEDQSLCEYINDLADTNYTAEQLQEIYIALRDIINESQRIVDEAENEADQALANDKNIYVLVLYYERYNKADDISFSCDEVLVFTTQEKADLYIDDVSNNELIRASIIDKDVGRSIIEQR